MPENQDSYKVNINAQQNTNPPQENPANPLNIGSGTVPTPPLQEPVPPQPPVQTEAQEPTSSPQPQTEAQEPAAPSQPQAETQESATSHAKLYLIIGLAGLLVIAGAFAAYKFLWASNSAETEEESYLLQSSDTEGTEDIESTETENPPSLDMQSEETPDENAITDENNEAEDEEITEEESETNEDEITEGESTENEETETEGGTEAETETGESETSRILR